MKRMFLAATAMAAAMSCGAATVEDSIAHFRQLRGTADKLAVAGADKAELQRAAGMLEDAQRELALAEQAGGDPQLHLENYNNLMQLAIVYSRQGRKEQALAALDQARGILWFPALVQMVQAEPAFDGLRDEPRFKALLAASALPERLWKGPAADHPYKEVLTVEERVAGLSQFWAEARHSFVYFDRVPDLDWDKVYLEYLTKVLAAQTTRDYYAVMLQLAPLLRDGHTGIWTPGELGGEFYATPLLHTVLAEGKVLVSAVDDASLRERVRVGDEVVEIDGMPVHDYARQRVQPLVSAGAPQDRDFQTYTVGLLRGSAAKPVLLRLRSADGKEWTETAARSAYGRDPSPPEFRMLDNGVAYISIEQFADDSGLKAFEAALPQILKARALVIDMRRNGGGNGAIGLKILGYLSHNPIPSASSYVRGDNPYMRASAGSLVNWMPLRNAAYAQPHEQVYEGPVAVLTGPQTYSAAEDFVVSFTIMKRGLTLGEATGGSTGQAINFKLPGGGGARVCAKRDVFPDGREFVGVGVAPDVEVKLTAASVRDGTDAVLARAIAELRDK